MVRLDTPTDVLIANILITFRLTLKIVLIEFRTKFQIIYRYINHVKEQNPSPLIVNISSSDLD